MARPVILGNGSLTVGINEQGLVHDFYYPYVGLENLTTARSTQHRIGVWVDGVFSWVDEGAWDINVNFDNDALISQVRMQNDELGVELFFNDFVDHKYNALLRKIIVTNQRDETREIRLFLHQVFEISRGGRADTALYEPDEHYILDYKGRCALLIYSQDADGQAYDQFAIGNYGIEGKQGTYIDAEDGELSGSAVEHGGVDSVQRLSLQIGGNNSKDVHYWIVAAESQYAAEKIHLAIKKNGLESRLKSTRKNWHDWLAIGANKLHSVDKQHLDFMKKSLMVIKAHTDKRGGIIASCDSSIYNYGRDYYSYVWPRDGAYAIWPLIRLGYTEEAKRFFAFCRDILHPDGYIRHKFQPDKAIGSTWHPMLHGRHKELAIQEDETAIVIYMLGEYLHYSGDEEFVESLYETLIQPAAHFMSEFIDEQTSLPHASYDLWEEKFLTSTYTVAVTYQALQVAAEFAEKFEHPDDAAHWRTVAESIHAGSAVFFDEDRQAYRKGYLLQQDGSLSFDNTIDISSIYGAMMFGLCDDIEKLKTSVATAEEVLIDVSPSGGAPRYEHDQYFESEPSHLGNPWFVTTFWMAQYYARTQQVDKANSIVDWAMERSLPSGVLSEQVNPNDSTPIGVTPLVWSHAEYINTVLDITKL